MKKSVLVTAAALLLILSIVTGCSTGSSNGETEDAPALLKPMDVPVNTATVGYNDILISSYYEATVVPYVEEYIFPISGSLYELHYNLGDTVNKGDLLAELDHEKIDLQIENLENRINSKKSATEKENTNYKLDIEKLKLKKDNIRSGKQASANPSADIALIDCDIAIYEKRIAQNLENLEKDLVDLEEQLEELLEVYPDYFLYAPMSGQVVYVTSETSLSPSNTVIAVADLKTKYIQTEVSTEYYIYSAVNVYALHGGERYDIMHVPAIYDTTCENLVSAKGRFANYIVNSGMDSFEFGDFVLVCIDTDSIENALSIPNTALFTDASGSFVYLVSKDGVQTRQDIVTSVSDSIHTIVLDGLKEGDVIYVPN